MEAERLKIEEEHEFMCTKKLDWAVFDRRQAAALLTAGADTLCIDTSILDGVSAIKSPDQKLPLGL